MCFVLLYLVDHTDMKEKKNMDDFFGENLEELSVCEHYISQVVTIHEKIVLNWKIHTIAFIDEL